METGTILLAVSMLTISGFVDLEIKADMTNAESINRALIPYGLSLKPATRMIEVLVIKEKTGKSF